MDEPHEPAWPDQIHEIFRRAAIRQVGYVPDAGHARLIECCRADESIRDVVLTTEEEGIALAAGAWLGGQRSAILMQSSGVGNCVNMLSLIRTCRVPLLLLITMRGEWEEFNPWQVPMGMATEGVLKLCDVVVHRAYEASDVATMVTDALEVAFTTERAAAVLLSQRLIGRKEWVK